MRNFVFRHGCFACAVGLILLFGVFLIHLCILKVNTYRRPYRVSRELIPASLVSPLPSVTYPDAVRALYVTASTAGSPRIDEIIRIIKAAEWPYAPNAVVIDIQDATGKLVLDDRMRMLVRQLRFLRIFPIARLVVFQNKSLAIEHQEWAVKRADGTLFRDNGGQYWLDAASEAVWNHVADTAEVAIKAGFAEINFDYFRFPSEGVTSAVYPYWSEAKGSKTETIVSVARYLKDRLKKQYPEVRLTADIFGYTFMRKYDLGIGQSAPALAAIFDDVCPMIYPSHYAAGNFNFTNPADHPYEVMALTLAKGAEIFSEAGVPFTNIRPWVQDFDLGAVYTPKMVRDQMKAVADAGLPDQWLIWNPRNKYRPAIFADDSGVTVAENEL